MKLCCCNVIKNCLN